MLSRQLRRLPRQAKPLLRRGLADSFHRKQFATFDGFEPLTKDCLIDLSPGADYTNKPDIEAYLSLFGRPTGTAEDSPSTREHVEAGRAFLEEAFKWREGLFIDPALLPAQTKDLHLANMTIPHAGLQGSRRKFDRQYMPWASMIWHIATAKNQAPGRLAARWARNLDSRGWRLSGLTPYLLGWSEEFADATLVVKTNVRAPIPATIDMASLDTLQRLAVVRVLYSDLFNVVYQSFYDPDATYIEIVHRALFGIPGDIEWRTRDDDEFVSTPVWNRNKDESRRWLVGEWSRPGGDRHFDLDAWMEEVCVLQDQ